MASANGTSNSTAKPARFTSRLPAFSTAKPPSRNSSSRTIGCGARASRHTNRAPAISAAATARPAGAGWRAVPSASNSPQSATTSNGLPANRTAPIRDWTRPTRGSRAPSARPSSASGARAQNTQDQSNRVSKEPASTGPSAPAMPKTMV